MAQFPESLIVALMGLTMFVAGFQFSLTIAVASPLVKRCLSAMYDNEYSTNHHGKYTSVLLAASNLCNAFANPFWGRSADKYGRRPVILIALGSASLSMGLFAATNLFWIALASRLLIGLLDPSLFVSKVVTGDISHPSVTGKRFSRIYTCFAASQMVSPFAASVFESQGWYPSLGPCLLASITAFAAFLAVVLFLPETGVKSEGRADVDTSWKEIATNPTIRSPVCLYAVLTMVLTSAEAATSYIITEKRAGGLSLRPEAIGLLFTIQGAIYIVTQLLICPRLIACFGAKNTFRACTLSLLIIYPCCVLPALATSPFYWMALQMSVKVIVSSSAVTSCTVLVNDCTKTSNRGAITSIAQSGAGISRSIGLLLIGVLYDYSAARSMLPLPYVILGAAAAVVSATSCVLLRSGSMSVPDKVVTRRQFLDADSVTVEQSGGRSCT